VRTEYFRIGKSERSELFNHARFETHTRESAEATKDVNKVPEIGHF
jgi:hypothetical protein